MSNYIDIAYLHIFLSEPQITALAGYGENVSGSQKVDLLISGSSDIIDSFLMVAGYQLPLNPVPDSIKVACAYLTLRDLYTTAQQPLPEGMTDQINSSIAYLNLLRDKKLQLDGLEQETATGTGGNLFSGVSTSSGEPNRMLSVGQLKGTFI